MNFLDLLKKYWFIPVILLVLGYFQFKDYQNNKIVEQLRENYNTFSTEREKIHQQELQERNKLIENYQSQVSILEQKYNNSVSLLNQERKNKILIIAGEIKDPVKLANRIKETYGFTEVPK